MYDVINIGSATVDALVKTEFCEMLHGKNKKDCIAYPVGSKILIKELILTIGGGGTNTAVALSRLGHKTAFLGKIGTGENSRRIINK
jgi:ribokinase